MIKTSTTLALAAILLSSASALAAPTAEQKCEGGKNQAAGKHAACIAKAEKGLVTKGDPAKYGEALVKCDEKLAKSWDKLEFQATDAGTTCPSTADQAPIADFLEACGTSVAAALAGGSLGLDPVACGADLTTCDGNLSTCTSGYGICTADLSTTNSGLGLCTGNLSTCTSVLGTCTTDLSSTTSALGDCTTSLDACENPVCGDNQADLGEQCDGTDLNGASCASLGFGGGNLVCTSCTFGTSGCAIPASCNASVAGADCGEQLLLNGDAETGNLGSWSVIPISSVNTWASSTGTFQQPGGTGTYLFVLGGNFEASSITQNVAVAASCGAKNATLSAYVGAAQDSLSGNQFGVMTLSFHDLNDGLLGTTSVNSGGGSSPVVLSLLSTGPVAIPAGTTTVRARFTRGGRHVIGIDGVTLTITC